MVRGEDILKFLEMQTSGDKDQKGQVLEKARKRGV
jgi:hypothetical protein